MVSLVKQSTTEWAQYTWNKPLKLHGAKVYWFDDTGRGECRLPASWSIEYLDGSAWKSVQVQGEYSVKADQWCETRFSPVTASSLRLKLNLKENWAAGVHEWKIIEDED